ncbi:hypothetical protein [Polyangium sp. 6x1]|uniref:hypothetical protein n=1 Tax=Polyangium sp. 6x1 TaxID=3042689 RepID=UPI0024823696|nr:hypothetical protein [Polyangium sp. 6x1]MDI1443437.1 hypothetical protein [Polyangium sp. 6x1]
MPEEKRNPNEKVPAEEAIEFEIAELDDLDLAGVTGGASVNGGGCTNGSCRSGPSSASNV